VTWISILDSLIIISPPLGVRLVKRSHYRFIVGTTFQIIPPKKRNELLTCRLSLRISPSVEPVRAVHGTGAAVACTCGSSFMTGNWSDGRTFALVLCTLKDCTQILVYYRRISCHLETGLGLRCTVHSHRAATTWCSEGAHPLDLVQALCTRHGALCIVLEVCEVLWGCGVDCRPHAAHPLSVDLVCVRVLALHFRCSIEEGSQVVIPRCDSGLIWHVDSGVLTWACAGGIGRSRVKAAIARRGAGSSQSAGRCLQDKNSQP
jgi:hypothetical protein